MNYHRFVPVILTGLVSTNAFAETIEFDGTGANWEVSYIVNKVAQNSVGRFAGESMGIGIIGVMPNAKGEDGRIEGPDKTFGDGTPTTASATQNGITINLRNTGNTLNPNAFGGGVELKETTKTLTGAWDITLQNGPVGGPSSDTVTFKSPSVCDAGANSNCAQQLLPDPVTNVKVSFASGTTTPTFTWDLGDPVDKISVSYYDLLSRDDRGRADRIVSTGLSSDTTSFTIPDTWGLQEEGKYAFRIDTRKVRKEEDGTANIDLIPTSSGGTLYLTPSGFDVRGSAVAETITFYDFSPTLGEVADDIYLPTETTTNPDGNPVFNFDNPVLANMVEYYDPILAIGYDYMTGDNDPNFASFILPEVGDNQYELHLWDGSDYLFAENVVAGDEYVFGTDGVDRFRILGIETSAGLDPTDTTAFVTGLSFVSDGQFSGTMTAITVDVPAAVPLPASWLFLVAGLGGFGLVKRRQKS